MAKTIGYGSVMAIATTTGGEVNIAQVRNISGPGVSANDVDTTCLDSSSNYRTFTCGLLDPGEVTFGLAYDSTSATHTRLARYMGARLSTTFWVFEGSTAGSKSEFAGYVKGLGREIPLDDLITCDVTVKVSGTPGYATA